MDSKRIIFIGNRTKVLEKILKMNYDIVNILSIENSYLHRYLVENNMECYLIEDKDKTIKEILKNDFDILISNGCPYILPVSKMKTENQQFINIHPSLLPNLRGRNPINGAFLYNSDAGATCHLMDDGVDTGQIISQIKIPMTDDLNLGLLYQLSFMAEADAFEIAHNKNFTPHPKKIIPKEKDEYIYYSRKEKDMLFSFNEKTDDILRKIKAFSIDNQYAHFFYKNNAFKVMDIQIVTNPYILNKINEFQNYQVICKYDNNLILKKENVFLNLKGIIGNIELIKVNSIILNE